MADTPSNFDPLPELPEPASRADAKEDYSRKADATNAAQYKLAKRLNAFIIWLNALIAWIVAARTAIVTSQDAAAKSVSDAAGQVKLAADQVTAARVSADAAGRSLTSTETVAAAVRAQINLPSLAGQKGKYWRVSDDEKTLELVQLIVNRVGDVLTTASVPDSSYVPDDTRYLQALYPELFAKVGLVGYDDVTNKTKLGGNNLSAGGNLVFFYQPRNGSPLAFGGTAIYKLTDAGPVNLYANPQGYNGLDAADDGKGVVVVCYPYDNWMRSTDNGATWKRITGMPGLVVNASSWNSIATDGQGTWIAVGGSGSGSGNWYAVKSTDNGATWSVLTLSGLNNNGSTPYVACQNRVFLLNFYSGTIDVYKSTNQGATWTTLSPIPNPAGVIGYAYNNVWISRVAASSKLIALVCMCSIFTAGTTYYNTLFVYSSDGGVTWQWLQYSQQTSSLSSSQYLGGRVVIGDDGTVVVGDVQNQNSIFVARNAGLPRRSAIGYWLSVPNIGGYVTGLATDQLGTWYLGGTSVYKKITPIYDALNYFYVPKLSDAPYPFNNYIKAKQ